MGEDSNSLLGIVPKLVKAISGDVLYYIYHSKGSESENRMSNGCDTDRTTESDSQPQPFQQKSRKEVTKNLGINSPAVPVILWQVTRKP